MDGIHLSKDGVNSGPYTGAEVATLLRDQKFLPTDHYWREGMESWQPLENLTFEVPTKIESKRILPTSVAIIARLLVIMQAGNVLSDAILPLFTLIPGFSRLSVPGLPRVRVENVIPFIHPFLLSHPLLILEAVLIAAVAIGCGLAMLRGMAWGRIGAAGLIVFWLIRPYFFGLDRPGIAGQLLGCFQPLAMGFFLLRPAANRFFSETGSIETPNLYGYGCVACLYLAVDLLFKAFLFPISYAHLGAFSGLLTWMSFCFWIFPGLLGILFLYFGLKANRFHAWKRDAAIVVGISLFFTIFGAWWNLRQWPVPSARPLHPAAATHPTGE